VAVRFEAGELVLLRQFALNQIANVRAARAVDHDERGLLLWIARGSPMLDWRTVDGRGIRDVPFAEWVRSDLGLVSTVWRGQDILMYVPAGQRHSVWWFWHDDTDFRGWYVNLEETAVYWRDDGVAGLDTVDQDLDITVAPDRTWTWKDVDEFTERLDFPDHYWVSEAAPVWAEGRRVIELIEAGAFPFDGTWCQWRPDPTWTPPSAIPTGWQRPRVF
jgi:hypothetical protein